MRRRLARALTALVVGFGLATGMLSLATVPAHAATFAVSFTIADQNVTVRDTITLSGKVSPKPKSRYVHLQRRYVGSTSWKTVKKIRTTSSGAFRATIGAGNDVDRSYRIYTPRQGSRKAGYSPAVQVVVDPVFSAVTAATPLRLSPASGALSGGTTVTIRGTRLGNATKVTFTPEVTADQTRDGTGVLPEVPGSTRVVDDSTLEVITPPSLGGTNLVRVYTPGATLTGTYTYATSARRPSTLEQQVLDEINARRAVPQTCHQGEDTSLMPAVPPVVWDESLADLALAHSRDLAARQDVYQGLSHVTYGTAGVQVRFHRAAVQGGYGEILALSPQRATAASVVDQWMRSATGHCQSVMSASWTRAGAGVTTGVRHTSAGTQTSIFSNMDFS
jgi:uncharacterized protein YkwD